MRWSDRITASDYENQLLFQPTEISAKVEEETAYGACGRRKVGGHDTETSTWSGSN